MPNRSPAVPAFVALALVVGATPGPVLAQITLPPSFGAQQSPLGAGSNPGFGQGGPSLVGAAWSGDISVQGLTAHGTDFYGNDGRYVSAVQLSNGMLIRVWGRYRTSSIGGGSTCSPKVRFRARCASRRRGEHRAASPSRRRRRTPWS